MKSETEAVGEIVCAFLLLSWLYPGTVQTESPGEENLSVRAGAG